MVCPRKDDFPDDGTIEGSNLENQPSNDDPDSHGSDIGPSGQFGVPAARRNLEGEIGLNERLMDFFSEEGDGDLLIHQGSGDGGVMQWLQALDLHVVGACRADERLKPLLKLNVSSGAAEERLLSHLNQHFEASEVGMLARCFCIPLVSIRVGKVVKNENLLCPTSTRGFLNLTLLPSSDLRISYVGDDGCIQKLTVLSTDSECASVTIEDISADSSGRSFVIKLPGGQISYFWCSEKSKLLGVELLAKMKDLLRKKPSVSQLTGISQSRLTRFATHFRDFFLGLENAIQSFPSVSATTLSSNPLGCHHKIQSVFSCSSKTSQPRPTASHHGKLHPSLYQTSLSPRSNTFKDCLPRNSLLNRNWGREKFKRLGDDLCSAMAADNASFTSTSTFNAHQTSPIEPEIERVSKGNGLCFLPSSLPESPRFSPLSSITHASLTKMPTSGDSLLPPYYCWCPLSPSTLQCVESPHSSATSLESLSLPPISSLISAVRSVSSLPNPTNVADVPSLDLPAFLPDPLSSISLPVSSFVTVPCSQQIPTFTPFISDPIVHIPVIDVCSSGQGYFVSAGPAISTSIAPLLPSLISPLVPEAESVMEKNARETLRLLIGSTHSNTKLMEMMPATLATSEKSLLCLPKGKKSTLVVGSRGLYGGTLDVNSNAISGVGFVSDPALPYKGTAGVDDKRRFGDEDGHALSREEWSDSVTKTED